jgi:hypothetical protein
LTPPDDDDVAAPEESIGDAVRAAFDTIEKAPSQEQIGPAEPRAAETDEGTAAASEAPSEGRQRGPDGKFLPKTEAKAPETTTEPPAAEPKPDAPKAAEPPANWNEADKALFKAAPPEIQALVARREAERDADYTRKTMAIAALKRDYEPVAEMFRPYEAQMRHSNLAPAKMIEGWMLAEKALMEGRGAALVADVARTYKIAPNDIARALGLTLATPAAGVDPPPAPQPPNGQHVVLPPEVTARLSAVDRFLADQQRRDNERLAQQRHEAETRVVSTIDQFSAAKGADGKPAHPYFAEVEDRMAQLLLAAQQAGLPNPTLDELYDQAVWASPSTRAKQLEATRAADEAQRKAESDKAAAEARAKAEKSRRAGSSVTGSPGTGQSAPTSRQRGSGSLRDDLMAAEEEVSSAA